MKFELMAKTSTACEITGMDPKRLNEVAHSGEYPCIPETRPGVARTFSVSDLIALRAFVVLTGNGITAAVAGRIVCAMRELMGADGYFASPTIEWIRVHLVAPEFHDHHGEFMFSCNNDGVFHKHNIDKMTLPANSNTTVSIHFDIAVMRSDIQASLENRQKVV